MPYKDGSPTLSEQIEAHRQTRQDFQEQKKFWNDGYHAGLEESKEEIQKLRIQLATTLISHGYPKDSLEPELKAALGIK